MLFLGSGVSIRPDLFLSHVSHMGNTNIPISIDQGSELKNLNSPTFHRLLDFLY